MSHHLSFAGNRNYSTADLKNQGSNGNYWSSSPNSAGSNNARNLNLNSSNVNANNNNNRANGFSVRCFKHSLRFFISFLDYDRFDNW